MLSALAPVVQTLLALVSDLLPSIGVTSTVVTSIITSLENIVPIITAEAQPLLADVQSIIAFLKNGSAALTADQLASLNALSAQIDATFEDDATADGYPTPAGS